mmetsp:Transcript_49982/g.96513  ORF Transcript_49982/g.96513 Transcript_49982/m.96513 type:complete len:314 (-) Transcript_49982:102-1043(-)
MLSNSAVLREGITPPPALVTSTQGNGNIDGHERAVQSGDGQTAPRAKAKAKSKGGPEAKAREERTALVHSNNALYAHMSDEELEKVLPRTSDGKTTSIGAMLHGSSQCAVCIFHNSPKGCYNGLRCKFCHAEHENAARPKRRRKADKAGENVGDEVGGDATPTGEGGGRKRNRRRANRRRRQRQEGLDCSSDDGSCDEDGDSWPLLDERGNSRPSWLRGEPLAASWPYGWPSPGAGCYGSLPPPIYNGPRPPSGLPPPGLPPMQPCGGCSGCPGCSGGCHPGPSVVCGSEWNSPVGGDYGSTQAPPPAHPNGY